jgi:hypothetical protein
MDTNVLEDTCISNTEQHTSEKEETKNNNRQKKDLHCLQLADRVANQKIGGPPTPSQEDTHLEF